MSNVEKNSFNKWYAEHGTAYNTARKNRYHTDPEYRERVLERQRRQRQSRPVAQEEHRPQFRTVGGVEVEVFRIGQVVAQVGRSEKTIRNWEASGWIPKPTVEGSHRYYTGNQVALIGELSALLNEVRYARALRDSMIQQKSLEIAKRWSE